MTLRNDAINVLLVEDDEVDIQTIQRAFKKFSTPVNLHIAKDGYEALDKIYGRNNETQINPIPELIILDINMPKMNGIEFLKKLRADSQFNSIKTLIVSTSNNIQDQLDTYNLNIDGYILKPIQVDDLLCFCKTLIHNV